MQLVWQHRDRQEWDDVIGAVFAGERPAPAPAAGPFSLSDSATAGAVLATPGFTAANLAPPAPNSQFEPR